MVVKVLILVSFRFWPRLAYAEALNVGAQSVSFAAPWFRDIKVSESSRLRL